MKKLTIHLTYYIMILIAILAFTFDVSGQLTITSTPSSYNGYNVSCFAGRDGSIDLTVSGGSGSYHFQWSNGAQTEDVQNLQAGYYRVNVSDVNPPNESGEFEITLTQPDQLVLYDPIISSFNGYSISLFGACNGSIQINPIGGTAPYSYLWGDNVTSHNRWSLCHGSYFVTVTDANGCTAQSEQYSITEPPPIQWGISGNANTDSSTQFIGTTDSRPAIIKTNNIERIRINKNGIIELKAPVKVGDLSITKPLIIDTIKVKRIMALDGDSIIRFGLGSLNWNQNMNQMYATPSTVYSWIKGLAIGDVSFGLGLYSYAVGAYARAEVDNSIAIGYNVKARASGSFTIGIGNASNATLDNSIANSIMLGTNSVVPTVFISPSSTATGTGNVGIGGATNPSEKFQIDNGNELIHGLNNFANSSDVAILKLGNSDHYIKSKNGVGVMIGTTNNTDIINISATKGIVGIGIDPAASTTYYAVGSTTNYKLLIGGALGAKEIWVSPGTSSEPWPDYVFNEDYKTESLNVIRDYVFKYKHLRNIPSANDIKKNGVINLGEVQTQSVKEIEELYLQMFKLSDRMNELEKENIELRRLLSDKK